MCATVDLLGFAVAGAVHQRAEGKSLSKRKEGPCGARLFEIDKVMKDDSGKVDLNTNSCDNPFPDGSLNQI